MTPQPKHCEHECVCGRLCATRARQDGKPCEPGYSHWEGCNYDTRSRPAPAPKGLTLKSGTLKGYEAGVIEGAAKEREQVQPLVDLLKVISTKRNEMQDIMRRNKIVINNVQEPMQKLAFTFYSEIGELAHMAGVVLEEYEESLREGAK